MVTGLVLTAVVVLCLLFTYTNGFQDGSSVCACVIACRALSPLQAVLLVATFEFAGALFGGSAVANTISSITSWPDTVDLLPVLLSALIAAIFWNFATKYLGLPSSSTHALVGGIIGAVIAGSGGLKYLEFGSPNHVYNATGIWKVVFSLFVSPLAGFVAGWVFLNVLTLLLMHATTRITPALQKVQWLLVSILAFAHGANDCQKAMGVMLLSLHAVGLSHDNVIPLWVRLCAGAAMAVGVISLAPAIVKRIGYGIFKLRPLHGVASEAGSALVVLTGSLTGGPVSASQVVASSVIGVGSAKRMKGVRWLAAGDMLVAWFLTIPCAAMLAGFLHEVLFHWLNGVL